MPLAAVVAAHRAEMDRRQRGQSFSDAFAVELFRRAVSERDPIAWEAVVAQYRGLVSAWVRRHQAYPSSQADAEDVVIRAFARFWKAVGPERLAHFAELAALMRYLKLCVHSVLLDEVRAQERPPEPLAEQHDIEALAVDRLAAAQLWSAITRALEDEAERLVVYLSFALGLTPSLICRRHPGRFASVTDVYRIKRNAIDRLRRSPEIRALIADS
jgi:DNA-directed RNA polymerase specialized sigma24 family protein